MKMFKTYPNLILLMTRIFTCESVYTNVETPKLRIYLINDSHMNIIYLEIIEFF